MKNYGSLNSIENFSIGRVITSSGVGIGGQGGYCPNTIAL